MKVEDVIHFSTFRLDCNNEQLWCGSQLLPLRPKPFAVLRYLAAHPGRLVTKEELLKAVWPDVRVSEGLLHTHIRDLRQVLGEDSETPRIIETVARRGYRFIGTVVSGQSSVVSPPPTPPLRSQLATENWQLTPFLVGREAELAQLQYWWTTAMNGERQGVFVTGEPGIGKTSLVEAFLQSLESSI
jgi:DNA-binding winged helix-turn-helix (wHTH) protein